MTDAPLDRRARELQAAPDPKGLFTPPPWEILTATSQEYWRVKARAEASALPAAAIDAPPWNT